MIFRATLALILCALSASRPAAAAAATYQRAENFTSRPDNWQYFHPNQFYGYQAGNNPGAAGSAGGIFQPKPYFNYFADTFLNGSLTRQDPISAAGRIDVDRISFDPQYTNSTYVCHFARGSNGFINTLGFALTGFNDENIVCRAILEFSDGTAFIGNSIAIPVPSQNPYLDWTYTWEPTAGTQGFGALTVQVGGPTGPKSVLNLTKTSAGLDFALDSFGLFQPPFVAPNSNTFLQFDISHLAYTALTGRSPKLRIQAPDTVTTSTSKVTLRGTATTTRGNRVTAVRYRVVTGGKAGGYRTASGTTHWKLTARVPAGASKVEVLAIGDNGLTKQASRRVRRQP